MPTQEELEYQQYLKETGQAPPAEEQGAMSKLGEFLTRGLKAPAGLSPQEKIQSLEQNVVPSLPDSIAASVPNAEGFGKLASWLGQKTGLSKIPGKLMERAVGLKREIPGAGDILLDKGIRGGRGQMLEQLAQKLPQEEAAVQQAVQGIQTPIDSVQVANRISDSLGKRMTSQGNIVSGAESQVDDILQRAKDVAARGDVSPKEALELARGAQRNSFKVAQGELRPGLMPELGQAEGGGYKDILKELSPDVASGLKNEQAMIEATKALEKPINQSPVSTMLRMAGRGSVPAAIGGAVGGPVGAAVGGTAGVLATSPYGLSTAAHGARAVGRGAANSLDPLARLIGISKQSQSSLPEPSTEDPEYQEYQQYLKEIGSR